MAIRMRWSAALLPVLLLGAQTAAASPQILGVIASAEPVELKCERGACGAEFTAICLERHRRSPSPGTAYYVHDPETVTLEGVRADGSTLALDVAELLSVTTERGHSAVRLSVPESVLDRHGLAAVRVSVGEIAALVPEPVPDDPKPHYEADIHIATGPLRAAAAAVVDRGGERIEAVRITARTINALPRFGRADRATRDGVWQAVAPPADAPGYALARETYERCKTTTRAGMQSLRQCLGSRHDAMIGELNTDYWIALELGS